MFGDPPIDAGTIREALADAWQMAVGSIEYLPVGYGSYHWMVADADHSGWFITLDRVDDRPLEEAYGLAQTLAGSLRFVRGPHPTVAGRLVVAVDGWWLSVWPWLEGEAGTFASSRSTSELQAVVRCLRRLHDHQGVLRIDGLTEDWAVPGRTPLTELVEAARAEYVAGPYSIEVMERLAANRSTILGWLARYDELVAAVAATGDLVLTHGEPHPGNVISSDKGLKLIDWDTVRWAPRERDLWTLGDAAWLGAYGDDVPISADALEVYRLQWTLVEVAAFVPDLLTAQAITHDADIAMAEIRSYLPLAGGSG